MRGSFVEWAGVFLDWRSIASVGCRRAEQELSGDAEAEPPPGLPLPHESERAPSGLAAGEQSDSRERAGCSHEVEGVAGRSGFQQGVDAVEGPRFGGVVQRGVEALQADEPGGKEGQGAPHSARLERNALAAARNCEGLPSEGQGAPCP